MAGLKNRFPLKVREAWQGWHSCHVCTRNGWNVLHHIISPTVRYYKKGDHNRSVLNSAPLHNYGRDIGDESCHIGRDGWLHKGDQLAMLLAKTMRALQEMDYEFDDRDAEFLKVYGHVYDL